MAIVLSDDEKNDNRAVGRRRSSMSQPQSRISDQDMFVLSSSAENQSTTAVSEKPSDDGDGDADVGSRYATAAESYTSISSPTYPQHRRASRRSSVLPPLKPFSPFQHRDGEPIIRDDDDDGASAAGVGDEDGQVLVRPCLCYVDLCCSTSHL